MIRSTLKKILLLPNEIRLLLAEIVLASLFVEIALIVLPFNKLLIFVETTAPRRNRRETGLSKNSEVLTAEIRRWAEAVFHRLPFRPSCLKQALIVMILLRRRRVYADLKIGLRKDGESLEAHAWLESGGQVIFDSSDVQGRYGAVLRLGDAR